MTLCNLEEQINFFHAVPEKSQPQNDDLAYEDDDDPYVADPHACKFCGFCFAIAGKDAVA